MNKVTILLLILICSVTILNAEIRAIWVTPWDLDTPAKCDKIIEKMIAGHQNEILAEVRYRSDALYVPNKTNCTYPNPDPRCYILKNSDFDALEYLIEKASPLGISVQAWLVIMAASTIHTSLQPANHLYYQHPEWFTWGPNGRMKEAEGSMGIFIDPGIPQVQEYLVNVVRDIAINYPELDGIHLDYIRYPARQYGKNPTSLELYHNETDVDTPQAWQNWRRYQISHIVQRMYAEVKTISPKMQLTAAVIANYPEAYNDYAQDWKEWLDGGFIDRVYLMAYTVNDQTLDKILAKADSFNHKGQVVVGLRAWTESGTYPISKILSKLFLARDYGFAGDALFSYEGMNHNGYWGDLTSGFFKEDTSIPPLPKSTQHMIYGYVTDADSIPYAGATLRIAETGVETRSDINGFYAFTNMPEGTFHLDVESDITSLHLDNLAVTASKSVIKRNIPLIPPAVAVVVTKPPVLDTTSVAIAATPQDITKEEKVEKQVQANQDFTMYTITDTTGIIIVIRNPREQAISWYVEDTNGKVVFSKENKYNPGEIVENWGGNTAEGTELPTGIYKIVAVSGTDKEQIYRSVFLNRRTN